MVPYHCNTQVIMNMWKEEQVAEKLKLYNERIQLMRHQSVPGEPPKSPKIESSAKFPHIQVFPQVLRTWGGAL